MWSSLLGMSLLISLNPILLGVILLIISRPRPLQSLLAYWVGALATNVFLFLTPLALLHLSPRFASFAEGFAAPSTASSPGVQPIPFVTGVLLILVATVMAVRARERQASVSQVAISPRRSGRRHRAQRGREDQPAPTASSVLVLESNTPTATPGLLGRLSDTAQGLGAKVRRIPHLLNGLWENGSVWVALVFGMLYLPSMTLVLLVDTTVVTSGASVGEQVSAAVMFIIGFLAILEMTLLSYVVAPAKTEAVLQLLHGWARVHNRKIWILFFFLGGVWQLARSFSLA
jgi:hypothetical protein